MYAGLEQSVAFAGVHRPPQARLTLVARPDLDAVASRAAHAHYLEDVAADRQAAQLLMAQRAAQRARYKQQRADVRRMEEYVGTPYVRAEARRAQAHQRKQDEERRATPRFESEEAVASQVAEGLTRSRGLRSLRPTSGVTSSLVRDRQLAHLPTVNSHFVHAPMHPPAIANALAAARVAAETRRLTRDTDLRPVGMNALHLLVSHMVEEKIQADAVDDGVRNPRQPLTEFVADELWRRYGLRDLALRHLANFRTSARALEAESKRVQVFADAMGWLDAPPWEEPKVNFWLAFVSMVFEVDQIKERLDEKVVWVSPVLLREAVRKVLYSKALETRIIEALDAMAEGDPTGEHLGGKRIDFDEAVSYIMDEFQPDWDTIVSHIHRPTYTEAQIYLSDDPGHYTAGAREKQGHVDVLPSDYTRDFYASSSERLLNSQQRRRGSRSYDNSSRRASLAASSGEAPRVQAQPGQ